jgi:hypothetical protein
MWRILCSGDREEKAQGQGLQTMQTKTQPVQHSKANSSSGGHSCLGTTALRPTGKMARDAIPSWCLWGSHPYITDIHDAKGKRDIKVMLKPRLW